MKIFKRIFGSYALSIPSFVLGLVLLTQSRDGDFVINAEKVSLSGDQSFSVATFLIIIGSIFILIAILSLLTRFLVKE